MKFKVLAVIAVFAGLAAAASAEMRINTAEVNGRLVDDINLPFVDDPALPGEWTSVDIVREPEEFLPGARRFRGDLFLKGITFREKGWMTGLAETWTRGVILNEDDRTASRYVIKALGGARYMFLEWKSGDYTIRHRKPCYYVLKKK